MRCEIYLWVWWWEWVSRLVPKKSLLPSCQLEPTHPNPPHSSLWTPTHTSEPNLLTFVNKWKYTIWICLILIYIPITFHCSKFLKLTFSMASSATEVSTLDRPLNKIYDISTTTKRNLVVSQFLLDCFNKKRNLIASSTKEVLLFHKKRSRHRLLNSFWPVVRWINLLIFSQLVKLDWGCCNE